VCSCLILTPISIAWFIAYEIASWAADDARQRRHGSRAATITAPIIVRGAKPGDVVAIDLI
jgi:acetamidase/formamidase